MINVLIFSLCLYWHLYSGNRLTIEKQFTYRLHTEKAISEYLLKKDKTYNILFEIKSYDFSQYPDNILRQ